MKKTIIALAVLAASGASMAQVSVSGKLGFSYQKNATTPTGAANHGLQMTDGDIVVSATEDLGGGSSVTASSAFVSRGRDTGITARDATITLKTGAGSLVVGAVEQCSRLDNVAGAPVSLASAHDGANAPLASGAYVADNSCNTADTVGFSASMGALTVGVSYNEIRNYAGPAAGNTLDTTAMNLSLDYSAGAFAAGVDITSFQAGGSGTAFTAATYHNALLRTRLSASYDLGIAKIGAGVESANHNSANIYTVSVAAPLSSAVSVGLIHSNRSAQTADATYYNANVAARNATAVGMDYKLGKTATVNVSYGIYSNSATLDNEYRVRLMKSF